MLFRFATGDFHRTGSTQVQVLVPVHAGIAQWERAPSFLLQY